MVCLVQGNIEDTTEVNRVGRPELISTAQLRDRDPVFQGDARERVIRRDLQDRQHRVRRTLFYFLRAVGERRQSMVPREQVQSDGIPLVLGNLQAEMVA